MVQLTWYGSDGAVITLLQPFKAKKGPFICMLLLNQRQTNVGNCFLRGRSASGVENSGAKMGFLITKQGYGAKFINISRLTLN